MAGSGGERRSKRSGSQSRATETSSAGDAPSNGAGGHGASHLMIDLDYVRGLISAVDESGIDSIEIIRAGTRIRISKTPAAVSAPGAPSANAPASSATVTALTPSAAAASAATAIEPAEAPGPEPKQNLIEVTSPMVGTFYRAPAPEAPPYVEIGSTISKGQTLCILEAMKLMNELESEYDGVVRQVLVENADPVEYGQVLFRIEPTGSSA